MQRRGFSSKKSGAVAEATASTFNAEKRSIFIQLSLAVGKEPESGLLSLPAQMSDVIHFITEFKSKRLGILLDNTAEIARAALVLPAQELSATELNRVVSITGGLPFVAVSQARAAAFLLEPMARPRLQAGGNSSSTHQGVTGNPLQYISVEAREGVTTGISASDRAATVSILGDASPLPRKLVKPGHIFPVEVRLGGVLVKAAIPEGALDIVTAAGFTDAALFLDLLDSHGNLLNLDDARNLSETLEVPAVELTSLIEYRLSLEPLIERVAEARLPTTLAGEVRAIVYRALSPLGTYSEEHIALVKGDLSQTQSSDPIVVRVQVENLASDLFGGTSRDQLHGSLKVLGEIERGVVLYLRRAASPTQYEVEGASRKHATIMREYGVGAQILRDLNVQKIELLSNKPFDPLNIPLVGLLGFGIEVVKHRSIPQAA